MRIMLFATLLGLMASPATAEVRVTYDLGGRISVYVNAFDSLRESGTKVVIDGHCLSGCTILLGLPRRQICVTRKAILGFHTAWRLVNGEYVDAPEATQVLLEHYPPRIKHWLNGQGGLTRQFKYLFGSSLRNMFDVCASAKSHRRAR